MRRFLPVLTLALLWTSSTRAQGLLIPTETSVTPLAMASHEVKVNLEDQVAVTHVTQVFRNHTSRPLEATYVFPVPKGASVQKFTMWVDGKEVKGELVEADKARQIYTDIVRRTQDPGLLEYMGNNLLKVRVFPVPANGEQKLAISFTSVAQNDAGLVEYVYPLKADAKAVRTLDRFTLDATLKAQQPIQSVYSPTHNIKVTRNGDREARVHFESKNETLDKDFQLYYTSANKDVGLTALFHRPRPAIPDGGTMITGGHRVRAEDKGEDGHFMMLISPRAELSRTQEVFRDMVFVLDTSGSMAGKRIVQARNALKFCLRNLNENDRFGLIHFATSAAKYRENLTPASSANIDDAAKWVEKLEAVGSTNIDEALTTALAMKSSYPNDRPLTVVFFTDGQPTVGECNAEKIVKNVADKNTADTRIFTFGVGDDVNAVLLDQLAEKTRSVATYVRETEDIEAKVSGLYAKISHPVLTNLKLEVRLSAEDDAWLARHQGTEINLDHRDIRWVTLKDVYPPQLPDLFHGSQLVVLGRYDGSSKARVVLTGKVGDETKEFVYEVDFKKHTNGDKAFVEDLWARRKVGYLLDQIRVNGEKKELKDEVVALAKKHGITTPYTSYLVVPDTAPVANVPSPGDRVRVLGLVPPGQVQQVAPGNVVSGQTPAGAFSPDLNVPTQGASFGGGANSDGLPASVPMATDFSARVTRPLSNAPDMPSGGNTLIPDGAVLSRMRCAPKTECTTTPCASAVTGAPADPRSPLCMDHSGKAGVDLSEKLSELRNQERVAKATVKQVAGRACVNLGGVWIDQGFDPKLPVVKVKAQSDAYFRILERQKQMQEVFQLGNRVAWVTPSQTVLVIDPADGKSTMTDDEIDRLFVAKK